MYVIEQKTGKAGRKKQGQEEEEEEGKKGKEREERKKQQETPRLFQFRILRSGQKEGTPSTR